MRQAPNKVEPVHLCTFREKVTRMLSSKGVRNELRTRDRYTPDQAFDVIEERYHKYMQLDDEDKEIFNSRRLVDYDELYDIMKFFRENGRFRDEHPNGRLITNFVDESTGEVKPMTREEVLELRKASKNRAARRRKT